MSVWRVVVYLLLPYALGNLIWRALRYPAYWHRWSERFGFVAPLGKLRTLWVHAVSVGEVRSAAPLVSELVERYPEHRVVVTTMTPTGSEQVKELFGDRVSHCYVPYDFPDAVRRFFDRVRPEVAVIAETEFWPNIFAECGRRQIPLLLVNGRVSQASLRGYLRVANTARRMLANADLLCAQTKVDAQRLRNLGAPPQLVHVTGNLKFDVELPAQLLDEARALRVQWGRERPVLIAASTHAGEERKVLDAFAELAPRFPRMLLVLVPRHPERFQAVARLCRKRGHSVALRSCTRGELPPGTDVLVGDTMGELQRLYAAADVAFIGGSLVPHGGQNLLEACAVHVPVVFGPHMFHFEEISAMALERGAARQVHDVGDLSAAIALYFEQPDLRRAAGNAAYTLVTDNRGALARTLELVEAALRVADLPPRSAGAKALEALAAPPRD
ncbi:MAG TPA: lipid IV(A) 3-deoxy-D-manno-octulosonic acid transferase [Gammaproteobacteria bacterium]|nr:lipid IV(A) 3-deoxy-D-manno-octulosonic acid transferase [Gammaproteobacteria bacterium]